MIEKEGSYATAVRKIEKKRNIMNFINCCSWFDNSKFTAVKIVLSKRTRKGSFNDSFIAEIKGLVGVENDIQRFVSSFEKAVTKLGLISSESKIMLSETA